MLSLIKICLYTTLYLIYCPVGGHLNCLSFAFINSLTVNIDSWRTCEVFL